MAASYTPKMKASPKCHDGPDHGAPRNDCTGDDSNVSVGGWPMGGANVIPRRCTLARVVLDLKSTISTLSLSLFMTSFAACVLPVGPRFEDPPAVENFAPTIVTSLPLQGSTVTAVGATQMFSVTATDPNVGDTLHARWLGEYPPYGDSSFIIGEMPFSSLGGQPWDATPTIVTSCVDAYARKPQHTITVLVSDLPFWDPGAPGAPTDRETLLTTNIERTQMAEANWVLNLTCSN
jgi:hypothetical protein